MALLWDHTVKRARLSCSVSESSDCGNNGKSKRGQLSGTSLLTTHSIDLDFTFWATSAWSDRIDAVSNVVSSLAIWALADIISVTNLAIGTLSDTSACTIDALLTCWAGWEFALAISVSELISGALSNTNTAIADALLTIWAGWEFTVTISVPDLIRGALTLFSVWAVYELAVTIVVSFLVSFALLNASASAIDSLLAFAAKSLADAISVSLLSITVSVSGARGKARIGTISQEKS